VNYYEIWFNLAPGAKDLELSSAVQAYLDHLKAQGKLEWWRLTRRKFGFGPSWMPEWHVTIAFRDLSQLDSAFNVAAARHGETERLHVEVYSRVKDFQSALYRDFPDAVRVMG
jgi:hypothetical protein